MNIFLFYFEIAIKITASAQNYRVGRVSGNTPIFLGLSILLGQIKNISAVRVTCQKKLGRVGRENFFFKNFFYIEKCKPILPGHNFFTCNTFISCFKLNREQLFF